MNTNAEINLPTMSISTKDQIKFASALEGHGYEMTGHEWNLIASEMNWTVEDTKTFAFWYLHQLFHQTKNERPGNSDVGGVVASEEYLNGNTPLDETMPAQQQLEDSEWAYEECILFDTLLIRYPQDNRDRESKLRWQKISTMLPNKSAVACKERYQRYFVVSTR